MKILLDTHAFIWWVTDDHRLSAAARQAFASADNELLLSAASTWEMSIKVASGKLRLAGDVGTFVRGHMKTNRIEPLTITTEHTFGVASMPRHHGDPFDRLMIAQATAENMSILTADPIFKQYHVPIIW
jgi:PIN domain nuclease of toxin-antitoxin system